MPRQPHFPSHVLTYLCFDALMGCTTPSNAVVLLPEELVPLHQLIDKITMGHQELLWGYWPSKPCRTGRDAALRQNDPLMQQEG